MSTDGDFVDLYPSNQPQGEKPIRLVILVIVCLIELIVIIVLAISLASASRSVAAPTSRAEETKEEDEISESDVDPATMGEVSDAKDLEVSNAVAPMAFWVAAKNGETSSTTISRNDCLAMITLGNSYAEKYSIKETLKNTACYEDTMKVSVKDTQAADYPFSDLKEITIGDGSTCASYSFYPSFDILHDLEFSAQNCDKEAKIINIMH